MFIINSLRRQGKNQREVLRVLGWGVLRGGGGVGWGGWGVLTPWREQSRPLLEKCQSRFLTVYSYTPV